MRRKPFIMKTNTFIASATLLMVVVYLLVLNIDIDEFDDMARFIPESALIYVEQHDATKYLNQFAESDIGKAVDDIDIQSTGAKIGLEKSLLDNLEKIRQFYEKAKKDKLIHELLGKRFSISILKPVNVIKQPSINNLLQNNAVVVSEPFHNATILEMLVDSYFSHNSERSLTSSQYGNHRVMRLVVDDKTISFVRLDGLFLLSINENQLRRCIDTFDQEVLSLHQNSEFEQVRQHAKGASRVAYFHLDNIRTLFNELLTDKEFPWRNLVDKQLKTTKGFTGLGHATWIDNTSIVNKVITTFDSLKTNPIAQKHLTTKPGHNSMFTMTSNKPMVYYWSNTLNLSHLFDYYKKQDGFGENILGSLFSKVEEVSGKSVNEIVEFLGQQVIVVIEPAKKDSFFELPLGLIVWQLKNGPDLQRVVEKIAQNYQISIIDNHYGPVVYYYWAQSPQDGIFPLYGFWQDYFFMGNSLSLFKKVIDNHSDSLSLLEQQELISVDPGFSYKNNSITYFDNKELIKVVKKALNMVSTLVAIEDKNIAEKIHILVNEVFNPLLEATTIYERSGTRSFFDKDMVIIESKTLITQKNLTGN